MKPKSSTSYSNPEKHNILEHLTVIFSCGIVDHDSFCPDEFFFSCCAICRNTSVCRDI